MKNQKPLVLGVFTAIVFTCLQTFALGQSQSTDIKVANVRAEGMAVRFESAIPYSNATLTISGPDGSVYRREFGGGTVPSLSLFDKTGAALGNGQYTYELRFTTAQLQDFKDRNLARPDDNNGIEDEQGRTNRSRLPVQSVVQSGSFALQNGTLYVGNETEPTVRRDLPIKNSDSPTKSLDSPIKSLDSPIKSPDKNLDKNPQQRTPRVISGNTVTRLRNHRLSLFSMPDIVQPDDVIIQGSACVGLDCVNGEVFGFDTIRMKENNTRLQFDDTSTAAGFPTNNWQIRANSSANGGASFLAFVDQGATGNSETGTIVFEVDAGAPANSVKVSSTGRVGFRTATPVLDLHVTTGDTPAHRLEQTTAGGFTAQTWDIAGNEANFFVRDVTGGSRLPFRIRPGAPTSSIDISASGDVGVGTASPSGKLHLTSSSTNGTSMFFQNTDVGGKNWRFLSTGSTNTGGAGNYGLVNATDDPNNFKVIVLASGNVGIGTAAPDLKLSVSGDADKSVGGGSWQVFSDERLKNIKGRFNNGLKAVMQLQPIRFEYKRDNALGLQSEIEQVGFGAQALQKIIPEAVTKNANGYLMVNNDPILWTMLNAIKEQQKEIVELKGQIRQLQSASHRRNKPRR